MKRGHRAEAQGRGERVKRASRGDAGARREDEEKNHRAEALRRRESMEKIIAQRRRGAVVKKSKKIPSASAPLRAAKSV